MVTSPEGQTYYYDPQSGATRWDDPTAPVMGVAVMGIPVAALEEGDLNLDLV